MEFRISKISQRRQKFVIERYGQVDIELEGMQLASVETSDRDRFALDPVCKLELYKAAGGEYVVAKCGSGWVPHAIIAESAQDLLLKLLDQDEVLGALEKLLLREAGKRDPDIRKISMLRLTPDAVKHLAETVRSASHVASSSALEDHLIRIERGLDADPEQAIGSAKELMETVAGQIFHQFGKTPNSSQEFPKYVKDALNLLELAPENIEDSVRGADAVRQVLRGLTQIVHGMAELRNVYGTGHGKSRKFPAEPRHARLAVGAAATVSSFGQLPSFALTTLDARLERKRS